MYKYKFMLIQILSVTRQWNDKEHVHIFIAKGHYQKS